MFGAGALVSGVDPELGRGMLNGGLFYDYYQTSDHQYLPIGSLEPNFAMALLQALGLSEWLSKIADQRPETQKELRAAIAEKVAAKTLEHWGSVFDKLDACVEPVLTVNQAAEHPQYQARNMIIDAVLENGEHVKQIATALPFEKRAATAGVPLGAHTEEILRDFGFSDQERESLKKSGCVR
jgi:crotonobetainyl-CoA:carnitine CoA-transferase CaiB-like acyl-CoA transferase